MIKVFNEDDLRKIFKKISEENYPDSYEKIHMAVEIHNIFFSELNKREKLISYINKEYALGKPIIYYVEKEDDIRTNEDFKELGKTWEDYEDYYYIFNNESGEEPMKVVLIFTHNNEDCYYFIFSIDEHGELMELID